MHVVVRLLMLLSVCVPLALALRRRRKDLGEPFGAENSLAAARNLAVIRIVVFSLLTLNMLWEDLPSLAYLPDSLRIPMGGMEFLHLIPGWDGIYHSPNALLLIKAVGCLLLLLAAVGCLTRLIVPLAVFAALVHGGMLREYSHLFHTMIAPLQLGLLLCFMPCGDALSFDAFFKAPSPSPRSAASYAWCRFLCWTVLASTYLLAGLSKLTNGGLYWWAGSNLRAIVLTNNFSPMHFDWGLKDVFLWLPLPVYSALGLATLGIELLYPAVLVSRQARRIFPLLALGMHIGILLSQAILFLDLIVLQAIFYDLPARAPSALAPNDRQTARQRFWPGLCAVLCMALALSWANALEYFPVTSWQIYSHDMASQPIRYWKISAVKAGGGTSQLRPDEWIRAVTDCRYRDYFARGSEVTASFLAATGARANMLITEPREKLTAVTLEAWSTNVTAAGEVGPGTLAGQMTVPISP